VHSSQSLSFNYLPDNFYENYGPVRRKIYNISTNKYFELGVSAIIGINIITMALEHYDQPDVRTLSVLFTVFHAYFMQKFFSRTPAAVFGYHPSPAKLAFWTQFILIAIGYITLKHELPLWCDNSKAFSFLAFKLTDR